jgi:hypothetical protein
VTFTPWYTKQGLSRRAIRSIENATPQERAKQLGGIWEQYIRAENATLATLGRAHVFKVPEDLRPVHSLGDAFVKAVYGGESWVDFCGVLEGGRFVTFDAKATEDMKWLPSQLAKHQSETLRSVEALGGLAFVYVFGGDGSKHVIPIGRVKKGRSFDLASDDYKKRPGETWLDTMGRIYVEQ